MRGHFHHNIAVKDVGRKKDLQKKEIIKNDKLQLDSNSKWLAFFFFFLLHLFKKRKDLLFQTQTFYV